MISPIPTLTPSAGTAPVEDLTRREFMFSAFGAALIIACGSEDDESVNGEAPGNDGRFPVRFDHKFGTTEVPRAPERVMSLGCSDHDPLLALGVVPVAVRYWYDDVPVFPWAVDRLNGSQPPVLDMPVGGDIDFEAIAAQSPDIIMAVYSGISEEDYARLSQIAPTIAQSDDYINYGMAWDEAAMLIGRALGADEKAEAVIAEARAKIEVVRGQYPELDGLKAVVAILRDGGEIRVYAPQDVRGRALALLGLEVPADIAELFGERFSFDLSGERIDNAGICRCRGLVQRA